MEGLTKAIILLVTYDCNLKCRYCYEPKSLHHAMTVDVAKEILRRELKTLDKKYSAVQIQFMGGEPLLRFGLIKNVSEWLWSIKPCGVKIGIHAPTNGSLLTPVKKDWFMKNKGRFDLALSFDGNLLMQNMNRSGSAVDIDIDFFAETYPDVGIKMTLSPDTIEHFYDGYRFLHEKGFKRISANLAIGDYVGWKKEHLCTLRKELDRLVDYFIMNPDIIRIGMFNLPVWNLLNPNSPNMSCRVSEDIVCYDYDGKDYPCHIFSPIALSEQLASASRFLDFDKIRNDRMQACNRCWFNKLCPRCMGANLRDRGEFNTPSPFDCAQFKLFFYANCKLNLELARRNGDQKMVNNITHIIKILKENGNGRI